MMQAPTSERRRLVSYYKEGGYDPIIKKGVMILLKRRWL
jgi:ribosomal protein S15P/S13E